MVAAAGRDLVGTAAMSLPPNLMLFNGRILVWAFLKSAGSPHASGQSCLPFLEFPVQAPSNDIRCELHAVNEQLCVGSEVDPKVFYFPAQVRHEHVLQPQ